MEDGLGTRLGGGREEGRYGGSAGARYQLAAVCLCLQRLGSGEFFSIQPDPWIKHALFSAIIFNLRARTVTTSEMDDII